MTTNEHTALPWLVELNPTIPEGIQVAAFEANGEIAGNRHLQVIIRSHNPGADAKLIVNAVNNYDRLREALEKSLWAMESYEEKVDREWGECRGIECIAIDGDLPEEIVEARSLLAELENLENRDHE